MLISDILSPERILIDIHARSKKSLLETLSKLLAHADGTQNQREIFDALCQRERLGSTGLGQGVAIPHGRVSDQDEVLAAFVRLDQPIKFDAPDAEPVDLIFALIVPKQCNERHLELVSQVAEILSDSGFLDSLRQSGNSSDLQQLLLHL